MGSRKSGDVEVKIVAWRRQHAALGAPAYRLTARGRLPSLPAGINLGKGKGEGGHERFWAPAEVEDQILLLRRYNARGFDIYVTPIDPDRWYLVLDDSTPDRLAVLRRDRGWTPALVQETSRHDDGKPNIQAIFIATKRDGDREAANALVAAINRRHGDPNFTGAVHPFRLSGFSNKKPGKGSPFARIIDAGSPDPDAGLSQHLRECAAEMMTTHAGGRGDDERLAAMGADGATTQPDGDAGARWMQYAREWIHVDELRLREIDFSRIDFRVTRSMLRDGWAKQDIARVFAHCSNDVRRQHGGDLLHSKQFDVKKYVLRTIDNARRFLSAPRRGAPVLFNPLFGSRAFSSNDQDRVTPDLEKHLPPRPE